MSTIENIEPSNFLELSQTEDNSDTANDTPEIDINKIKYFALLKECNQIEVENCRKAEQVFHINKIIKRLKKERCFLMKKLDGFGDDYKNAKLQFIADEETKLLESSVDSDDHFKLSCTKKKLKVKKRLRNGPKKPSNAFLIFCQRKRAQLQQQHQQQYKTELSRQEITKVLAEMWKAITEEEKQIYFDMYQKDKLRYADELKKFQSEQKINNEGTNEENKMKISEDKTKDTE